MISNERDWPHKRPAAKGANPFHAGTVAQDKILHSHSIEIERKKIHISLRENPKGRFVRITEDVRGRKNSIIIPASGLNEFVALISKIKNASNELPPTQGVPPDKSQG